MHGVLGRIRILEGHASSCSQRRAAHHQAVVVLDPLEHLRVERPSGCERRAGDMDILQLAVVIDAQVGNLHTEGRNTVAVAALPLRDADVRLCARRGGRAELPVDVGLCLGVLHRDSSYSAHRAGNPRVEEEEESAEPEVNPKVDRHSWALESSMQEILTATLGAAHETYSHTI